MSLAQEFDLVMKALAERYPAEFVGFVRGVPVSSVVREEKEAVAVRRDNDVLFRVDEEGYSYLVAMEIQTEPDKNMPRRLLEYMAMQHREFGLPVYPVVLNLTGKVRGEAVYGFDCLELSVLSFRYRQMNLADMAGGWFLETCPVGLVPLVPLMRHDDPPIAVLAACANRIERAPEATRQDLYAALAVMASLVIPADIIKKIIEVSKMEASPLFDGIREKWVEQGKVEGRAEGKAEGKIEGKIEIAKKMLLSGMDIDAVIKFTGLDRAKVEELIQQLKH